MSLKHDEIIKKSVWALCDELIKHYPDILKKEYNQNYTNNREKSVFEQRMERMLDMELMRAGYGEQEKNQ